MCENKETYLLDCINAWLFYLQENDYILNHENFIKLLFHWKFRLLKIGRQLLESVFWLFILGFLLIARSLWRSNCFPDSLMMESLIYLHLFLCREEVIHDSWMKRFLLHELLWKQDYLSFPEISNWFNYWIFNKNKTGLLFVSWNFKLI